MYIFFFIKIWTQKKAKTCRNIARAKIIVTWFKRITVVAPATLLLPQRFQSMSFDCQWVEQWGSTAVRMSGSGSMFILLNFDIWNYRRKVYCKTQIMIWYLPQSESCTWNSKSCCSNHFYRIYASVEEYTTLIPLLFSAALQIILGENDFEYARWRHSTVIFLHW
jgi:hypothetical protein